MTPTETMNLLQSSDLWLMEPAAYMRLSAMPGVSAQLPGTSGPAAPPRPPYTRQGGLAVVPVHGALLRRASGLERMLFRAFGEPYAESAALAQLMAQLQADPDIHTVLLDIDSPGGSVNGTPELAAAVARLSREKHTYAYTAGLCCSAAYWVASQADAIYAAPSARVGSIGVLMPVTDTSEAYSQRGVKVEVFAAGRYKAAGLGGTSMTDEQRELLQHQVEATWQDFKSAVNRRRSIADEDMEGQTFSGTEARRRGLVDARADSVEFMVEKLLLRHG